LLKKAVITLVGKVPVLNVNQAQMNLGNVSVNLSKIDTSFIIQNTGLLEDSVTISVSTNAGDNSYAFSQNIVSLSPKSSKNINITIYPSIIGPNSNATYTFTINSKFGYGTRRFSKRIILSTSGATAVEKTGYSPDRYELKQNYPNPFNPSTCISYDLPEEAKVEISIYNLLGEKVNVLFTGTQEKGNHNINWNAAGFATGIYFCCIKAEGKISFEKTRKLVLLK
jgi:hypothetical protein